MGKVDIVAKSYMGDAEVFADAFNYYLYGGERVIDSKQLKSLDPTELEILQEGFGRLETSELIQRYRDLLKLACIMTDQAAIYLILGIENQRTVNYAMPVKNMSYDSQQYAKQVAAIARRHRRKKDYGEHNSGEYLSGFYKEDRILPVVTLVVFFGPGRWDGPLSLHEMLSVKDRRILNMVQDYKIHLIEPADLGPEDFDKFRSSLREVLSFIKYSQDRTKITELLEQNRRFQALDREAARMIQVCTNIEMGIKEGAEVVDMCKAIDDMMAESREKGREEERANTERERKKAEQEKKKAEQEKKEKERQKKKAKRERRRADAAEAEVRKLRKELERYKKGA